MFISKLEKEKLEKENERLWMLFSGLTDYLGLTVEWPDQVRYGLVKPIIKPKE